MATNSIVSGWHYQPLSEAKRAERDVWLRMLVRAAYALAKGRLVRCTDFAFEQRAEIKTAVPGKPGIFRYKEEHTMAPLEEWLDAHGEGTYRLEVCVQVNQGDRGVLVEAVRAADAIVVGAIEAEEAERLAGRVARADLARVFALLRKRTAEKD